MIANEWTAEKDKLELAITDSEASDAIDVKHLHDIWKCLPFLKNPRSEEELETLIDFSEELHEAIEGDSSHPLYSLYQVAETLILDYEKRHLPEPESDPVGCLKFLMEQHDMRQVDLVKMGLGSQGVVSELLSGKREFNKRHIQILSKNFGCRPGLFFST